MHKKIFLLLAITLTALAGPVYAQQSTPSDDDVNRIAKQLFCPVCENVPLDVCPTQACAQWRATIREKLGAGWTDQQIFDYFVAQYGERVLAKPSTRGLNLFIWVMPPVALGAGAFFLWRFLRGTAGASPAPDKPEIAPDDEYGRRLEKELERRI